MFRACALGHTADWGTELRYGVAVRPERGSHRKWLILFGCYSERRALTGFTPAALREGK